MPPSSYQAILLVDGYNIIGDWSDLKTSRDRDGLEVARRELIECLINYSASVAYRTKVVFDAHYQDTPVVASNILQIYQFTIQLLLRPQIPILKNSALNLTAKNINKNQLA